LGGSYGTNNDTNSAKQSIEQSQVRKMVEPMGFEPTTSSMPSRRAPNCATAPPRIAIFSLPYTLGHFRRQSFRITSESSATSLFSSARSAGCLTFPQWELVLDPLEQNLNLSLLELPSVWISSYFKQTELLSFSPCRVTPITFFHKSSLYLRVDIFTGFFVSC
jgi:hypothetical protein